jgi:hypothetical protein
VLKGPAEGKKKIISYILCYPKHAIHQSFGMFAIKETKKKHECNTLEWVLVLHDAENEKMLTCLYNELRKCRRNVRKILQEEAKLAYHSQ